MSTQYTLTTSTTEISAITTTTVNHVDNSERNSNHDARDHIQSLARLQRESELRAQQIIAHGRPINTVRTYAHGQKAFKVSKQSS